MKKFLAILVIIVGIICMFTTIAFAAPTVQYLTNISPFIDNTYDNGDSTHAWRNIFLYNEKFSTSTTGCFQGGTTASGIVTGYFTGSSCGGGVAQAFAWPFTAHTGYVSTSTTVGFLNGLFSTASSTFSSTLNVYNTATFQNGLTIGIGPASAGSWIDLPTTGSSGIGTGGAGSNPFIAYVSSNGHWFGDSLVGDVAYVNHLGRILMGTDPTSAASALILSGTQDVIFNGLTASRLIGTGTNKNAISVATTTFTPNSDFSTTGTIGALVGGANSTLSLNMATAHNWTGLNTFLNSSSTLFSARQAWFGGSATTTIGLDGSITMPSGSTFTKTGVSDGCGTWASGVLGSTGSACGSGGGGSGTISTSTNAIIGHVANWTGLATLGNGALLDNGVIAGINATSSTVDFLVQASASNVPFQVNNSSSAALLTVAGIPTSGCVLCVASSTGTSMFVVNTNGTVGIGTTTNTAFLHVQGTTTTSSLLSVFNIASSTGMSLFQITGLDQILVSPNARLTIPQSSNPTLSANGDIAIDTSNGGLLSFYSNGEQTLTATTSKGLFFQTPTAGENHRTGPIISADVPITITKVTCLVTSETTNSPSWTFSLPHSTILGTATSNVVPAGVACTSTTSPQNITITGDNTLAAGEMLWATSSAVSNASSTEVMIYYKYDR